MYKSCKSGSKLNLETGDFDKKRMVLGQGKAAAPVIWHVFGPLLLHDDSKFCSSAVPEGSQLELLGGGAPFVEFLMLVAI